MDNITFGQALSHCFHSASYVVWLVIAAVLLAGVIVVGLKKYNNGDIEGKDFAKFLCLAVAIFAFALLMRPCEIWNNTTKEQAARGVYIGY